ncbi:sulfite exporter TauE/SafE family protein [Colwellia sp. UCD-KL20]|uniref:sulfite exporter TauE/SafE family protein n=1 Tax=Colwellia sp. UCD-KL20 TaxID=1917165 RepID=UPI0015C30EAD|nr:sulfite exporter TauE/SafE family protein [Colwellia sp. UCD-KL20]
MLKTQKILLSGLLQRNQQVKVALILAAFWLLCFYFINASVDHLHEYSPFLFLGTLGAFFANATGAGGGVIFIPAFNQFGFTEVQSVATSFAIQCFGMTAGAITWYKYYQSQKSLSSSWQGFHLIIVVCSICSVIGLWLIYGNQLSAPASLHVSFSWFSLFLGLSIFTSVYFLKTNKVNNRLLLIDWLMLIVISLLGGAITAWLSVGVGELIAIYLIVRRFDVTMAVSTAVVISAVTVWAGIWQHLLVDFQVYWQVVFFAGPGAIIGGVLAKKLVMYMSVTRLKLFFAFWLFVIGGVGIT